MKAQVSRFLWAAGALAVICLSGIAILVSFAADRGDAPEPGSESEVALEAQWRAENEKLREENERLRKENQLLRRMLAEQGNPRGIPAEGTAPVDSTRTNAPRVEGEPNRWLTALSGQRHNGDCKYFRKTLGRLCGPDEGTPCRLCGG